jgi:hypothetical protein
MVTYKGLPQRSFCPFCGVVYADFEAERLGAWLIGGVEVAAHMAIILGVAWVVDLPFAAMGISPERSLHNVAVTSGIAVSLGLLIYLKTSWRGYLLLVLAIAILGLALQGKPKATQAKSLNQGATIQQKVR